MIPLYWTEDPLHVVTICEDCDTAVETGAHSVITEAGRYRVSCDGCFRWRERRGLEFDARSRQQIAREAA